MEHTTAPGDTSPECGCAPRDRINFLDTEVRLEEGKLVTDLYRKPTDRNQYLLLSSCHPPHITTNLPFSLAIRILKICTKEEEEREKRWAELKELLLARGYKPGLIDS